MRRRQGETDKCGLISGIRMEQWQEILVECGLPTTVICQDYETFFDTDYSLSKLSTIEYITDERFAFTGLGLLSADDGISRFVEPGQIEDAIRGIDYDNVTVLQQNCRFDSTITQVKFGIVPPHIIDLKDLASHYDSRMSHKLADLAKLFKLKPKGRTENFKGLLWDNMSLSQRSAFIDYTKTDVELETQLFKLLLPYLSNPRMEYQLARHTLSLWLHKGFKVDRDLARKLQVQMRTKIAAAIQASGRTPKELRSRKLFPQLLQEALPDGETVPMKAGKRGNIPALAKTDEACQQLMVHPKKEVRDLMEAKMGASEWNAHILKLGHIVTQSIANGGLLRVAMNYHACHTGRWGGCEGYNQLNMTKRDRGGIETDPLKKETRKTLSAPDGYILGVCDSAQIEARIVFWLAGQQDMLDKFANGEDLYSEYASKLFKEPCRKPKVDDPPDVYARFDLMRNMVGKTNVLGDGYGLGANRFYNNCLSNPKLRPLFDSGEWNFKFCRDAINLYRSTCSKVVKYWDRVENAFRRVVRFPHLEAEVGPVTFRNDHGTVEIVLPSGRILYYRHTKIDRKNSIKWQHGTLWGGSLTENIDQAISRCLLGCWILDLEKAGIPVISHVYDSIETLLPEDQAEELLAKQAAIMCTAPSWADGLPLAVDSKLSKTL